MLCLTRKNTIITSTRISSGGRSGTVVDPRIIFRTAFENHSFGIIVCHNHPSGNPKPSVQDAMLTRKLMEGGKLLEIYIGDHVIIGGDKYYSFADEGLVYR